MAKSLRSSAAALGSRGGRAGVGASKRRSITVCLFTSMTYALKLFETVLVMTGGGPAGATKTIVYNLYEEAFVRSRYGYGTAKSLALFVMVLAITGVQLRIARRLET